MKFLVVGAGRMGYAAVYDLIRSPRVEQVIVADRDASQVKDLVDKLSDSKIVPVELDVSKIDEVVELMSRCDVCISCVDYHYNYELAKAALKAGIHFCDLGGNEQTVAKEFLLNDLAKERGISIIPDLGLAPGLVSMLAVSAAESMDELYDIHIRVGGVPLEPAAEDPMKYCQVFAMEGLINELVEDVTIIKDGKVFQVPSLTDLEEIDFPKPFGKMEAFNTSGGISTLPQTYANRIRHLDYKTIRYPGHCEQMSLLKHLGLMSSQPVKLKSGTIAPRELLSYALKEKMPKDAPDAVLLRVTVTGVRDKTPTQLVWECVEFCSEADNLSAMMRMTAFPASIIAQMIAKGDITERGVLKQESGVPVKLFLAELNSRGIKLTMTEREPVTA